MIVRPLTPQQAAAKRAMDVVLALLGLVLTGWAVLVLAALAARDTGASGIFRQTRVGQDGEPFTILKIRTMQVDHDRTTTATTATDPRVTPLGRTLRRRKLDELPQLWNVLRGDMSLVGPRPDVPGYYDRLEPPDDVLLTLRPGITSPSTLRLVDEEVVLAGVDDPDGYNDEVLFPAKVAANLDYLAEWSLQGDVRCLVASVVGVTRGRRHGG